VLSHVDYIYINQCVTQVLNQFSVDLNSLK
jgi:hypothetical protein